MIKRIINEIEIHKAHDLIIGVFNLCHAEDTTEEAKKCFIEGNTIEQFISGNNNGSIKIWGNFENNKLCGVVQLQNDVFGGRSEHHIPSLGASTTKTVFLWAPV